MPLGAANEERDVTRRVEFEVRELLRQVSGKDYSFTELQGTSPLLGSSIASLSQQVWSRHEDAYSTAKLRVIARPLVAGVRRRS